MIFTELPPIHHLQSPTPSYHYAESPLNPRTPRTMNKTDSKPIFSFSPIPLHESNATTPSTSTSTSTSRTPPRETSINNTTTSSSSSSRSKTTPTYAHRYQTTLTNPLKTHSSVSPTARNNRRNAFLNRVKADRDEGRFENRADQFMRLEHDAERRVWGEEMGRTAEGIMRGMDIDMEGEGEGDGFGADEYHGGREGDEEEERALDEFISQEEAETMEMEMEMGLHEKNRDQEERRTRSDFGSFSDDEYDHLFMDLAGQGMDMSSG